MKKYIIIFLLVLFIMPLYAKAIETGYNGDDDDGKITSSGDCKTYKGFCPISTFHNTTLKVTVAYVSNGKIKRTYASFYFIDAAVNVNKCDDLNGREKDLCKEITKGNYMQSPKEFNYFRKKDADLNTTTGWYSFDSTELARYFKENFFIIFDYFKEDEKPNVSNEDEVREWMRTECDSMNKKKYEDCHGPKGSVQGFRILIEPVFTGTFAHATKFALKTPMEIAQNPGEWSNPTRGIKWSISLHTTEKDVGIMNVDGFESGLIANIRNRCGIKNDYCNNLWTKYDDKIAGKKKISGFGLNIVDWIVDDVEDKTCECDYDTNGNPYCKDGCDCDLNDCPIDDYKLTVKIPKMCDTDANSGYVKDIKDWELIFKSKNNSHNEVKTHYYESGNAYCKIYCREEIAIDYPSVVNVNQGRYMVVNKTMDSNISPLKYTGTRVCRVTSDVEGQLNKAKFESDLASANNAVRQAWDKYQTAQAVYKAYTLSTSSTERDNESCTTKWIQNQETVNAYKNYNKNLSNEIAKLEKQISSASADVSKSLDICLSGADAKKGSERDAAIQACNYDASASYQSISEMNKSLAIKQSSYKNVDSIPYDVCPGSYQSKTKWTSTKVSYGAYSGSQGGGYDYAQYYYKGTNGANTRTTFSAAKNRAENAVKKTYDEYTKQKGIRDNIITTFENCTTRLPSNVLQSYNFKPKVSIRYEEDVYGGEWIELDSKLSQNTNIKYYLDDLSTTQITTAATGTRIEKAKTTECEEKSKCKDITQPYTYSKWWESSIEKTHTYLLPSSTYRYVEKGSGQAVSTKVGDKQYYDIGYGNLPIHFSTLPGEYEYEVKTTSFGNENKFNKFIFQGDKFAGKKYKKSNSAGNLMYGCNYNVNCTDMIIYNDCVDYYDVCPNGKNNITCIGIGLNVIYRTISLRSTKEAFPGISGTGRKPGANWTSNNINDYILNNRGAASYDVYKLKPMYEIELTPAIMKLFRNYNKEMNKTYVSMYNGTNAAKIGIAGYSDFLNMTCTNGANCKSSLLRGNVTKYSAIKVVGCAINGTGYNNNCGRNQAW